MELFLALDPKLEFNVFSGRLWAAGARVIKNKNQLKTQDIEIQCITILYYTSIGRVNMSCLGACAAQKTPSHASHGKVTVSHGCSLFFFRCVMWSSFWMPFISVGLGGRLSQDTQHCHNQEHMRPMLLIALSFQRSVRRMLATPDTNLRLLFLLVLHLSMGTPACIGGHVFGSCRSCHESHAMCFRCCDAF